MLCETSWVRELQVTPTTCPGRGRAQSRVSSVPPHRGLTFLSAPDVNTRLYTQALGADPSPVHLYSGGQEVSRDGRVCPQAPVEGARTHADPGHHRP